MSYFKDIIKQRLSKKIKNDGVGMLKKLRKNYLKYHSMLLVMDNTMLNNILLYLPSKTYPSLMQLSKEFNKIMYKNKQLYKNYVININETVRFFAKKFDFLFFWLIIFFFAWNPIFKKKKIKIFFFCKINHETQRIEFTETYFNKLEMKNKFENVKLPFDFINSLIIKQAYLFKNNSFVTKISKYIHNLKIFNIHAKVFFYIPFKNVKRLVMTNVGQFNQKTL